MQTGSPDAGRSALRTFLTGHALSTVGSKMQSAALLWHVYQLTGSAVALGALGVMELLPILALGLFGGLAADRYDRRRVLAVSQAAQAVPALLLGALTLWGAETVWLLYLTAAACAAAQAFDTSARKALIPRLVPERDLAVAMSWMDMIKNTGKLGGPALMGLLVSVIGLGPVYLLNGLSFVAMLTALYLLPSESGVVDSDASGASASEAFRTVATFVKETPLIGSLILLDFLGTFFAAAEALLPIVADKVLGVGAAGYGVLASAAALGALLAGAGLLVQRPTQRLGTLALVAVGFFGASTIAFGLAGSYAACFVALVGVGAADTVSTVVRNTLLQLYTPDALRGRVTAVNTLFSKSGPRLGQLEAGLVASAFGVTASIVSGGVLCIGAAVWVALRHPWLRSAGIAERDEDVAQEP